MSQTNFKCLLKTSIEVIFLNTLYNWSQSLNIKDGALIDQKQCLLGTLAEVDKCFSAPTSMAICILDAFLSYNFDQWEKCEKNVWKVLTFEALKQTRYSP